MKINFPLHSLSLCRMSMPICSSWMYEEINHFIISNCAYSIEIFIQFWNLFCKNGTPKILPNEKWTFSTKNSKQTLHFHQCCWGVVHTTAIVPFMKFTIKLCRQRSRIGTKLLCVIATMSVCKLFLLTTFVRLAKSGNDILCVRVRTNRKRKGNLILPTPRKLTYHINRARAFLCSGVISWILYTTVVLCQNILGFNHFFILKLCIEHIVRDRLEKRIDISTLFDCNSMWTKGFQSILI